MTHPTLDEAQIRETAYLIWLDEGQPEGRDQDHWLKAIDALTAPKPKAKRKTTAKTSAAPKKAAPKSAKAANSAKAPAAKKTAARKTKKAKA